MRKKKLKLNTQTSLILQIITLIYGIIVPRLILKQYGSDVNGLLSSVKQFLQVVAFLELGIGAVIQASLYKPLAYKDFDEISRILRSGDSFFKKIAAFLVVYIAFLIVLFPKLSSEFDIWYSGTLILVVGISFLGQYYLGIIDYLLLSADQKIYVYNIAQSIALVLATVFSFVLIMSGMRIQIVQLAVSSVFVIRPIVLRIYVNTHYSIDRKIVLTEEPIKQKWYGVAQHIAAIVLDGTDIIIITVLSVLSEVSVYAIYNLIVGSVKRLVMSLTGGVQSVLGEMWSKKESDQLIEFFSKVEWAIHATVTYVFSCVIATILPFVALYTRGVTDTNYIRPLFAVLITIANAGHCLRLPYNMMILAAGRFKETKNNYIIASLVNIILSIILIGRFGLVGVVLGTLIAMLFQTIWMAQYCYLDLLRVRSIGRFVKHMFVDGLVFCLVIIFTMCSSFEFKAFYEWIIYSFIVAMLIAIIMIIVNLIFDRDIISSLLSKRHEKRRQNQRNATP